MSDPNDLTHRAWRFPEYIAAFGKLYTPHQALDYFSQSIFWDKQSTNQVLRMQTMHAATAANGDGMAGMDEQEELRKFTGVEFAVVHGRPPGLWVVHKRERISPEEVRPISAYFIMNETIYQSPDLYTVFSTSLVNALHSLQSGLRLLRAANPTYTPREGYTWPIAPPKPTDSSFRDPTQPEDTQVVHPLNFAFQTAASYITSSTLNPRRTPDEDDLAADESGEPDLARAGTRDSLTPAPTTGGKGKSHGGPSAGGGGKSKRRRKSRALTEFVDSPVSSRAGETGE